MILYLYIIRQHFFPFLFSIVTLMFIFLFQFLMKFADRLVGKGLDTWIVIKLITYNLSWMVVLVIPMSVLVATLMAFGQLSQNNEITVMKSSGISLYKMMLSPFLVSILLAYLMVRFNNDVLPDANHQAKILMQEISQTKPTLSLEPGVFSQEVTNYAILVREVDPKSNRIKGVTIYDYNDSRKINIVTAKDGNIYFSKDQTKLIMDLREGEIHESNVNETNLYRKLVFTKHRITMNAEEFTFQQSSAASQRTDRELSAADMRIIVDSLKILKTNYEKKYKEELNKYSLINFKQINTNNFTQSNLNSFNENKATYFDNLIRRVKTYQNNIISAKIRVEMTEREINKYMVEIHKKYSIPAACIIFILLGAPLGVIIRKGGFGISASISLIFFMIYWASLIGGEKLADRAIISPFLGMWAANILMGILGILLTYRVGKEIVSFDLSSLLKIIPKSWRQNEVEQIENN